MRDIARAALADEHATQDELQETEECAHTAPRTRVMLFDSPVKSHVYCSACGAALAEEQEQKR
jgi:hypothetical protein